VFILQEDPPLLHVLEADFSRVVHTIRIDLADGNSGGEGFLPLRNGHLLVLKEKNPIALLEFAPSRTAAAQGFRPELGGGVFPLPPGSDSDFHPIRTWHLSATAVPLLRDASELACGRDGRLYLLSDESRRIARLRDLPVSGPAVADLDRVWDLPVGIVKPEGLAFDERNRPVIAVDHQDRADDLFVLSPLED
jgi:uncharacterized protein YjiK